MRVREVNKKDIAQKLASLGDYVKMEYLESCLHNRLDYDTRKFVMVKLSGLYELRGMFLDAGRVMRSAAEINTTERDMITDFVKSAELFVKAWNWEGADLSMKKALRLASAAKKGEILATVKEHYKTQAKLSLAKDKNKRAMEVYEVLLTFDLSAQERDEVTLQLLGLYEKLGKIREFYALKRSVG